MSSPQHRGRRVPPKSRGARPIPSDPTAGMDAQGEPASAGVPGSPAVRPGSRSANRAAKRATTGVRPKTGVRGRPGGRQGRSSSTGILLLAIGAVAIGAAVLLFGNPFGSPAASASPGPTQGATQGAVQSHGDGTCPTSQPPSLAAGEARTVTIETPKGTIVLKIDGSLAPIATGNFIALAACHFYDGIVFHRLVPGFVIQGGDPEGTGGGGPGYAIKDDPITTTYHRGTVAMARTPQADSQGSQFFIVLSGDADQALSGAEFGYAILGEVTSGMDVVDVIAAMPNSGEPNNTALEPVPMTKVTVSGAVVASPSPATSPATSPAASPTASPEASLPTS